MTDQPLRKLERSFRQSATVEDEAAWLRERVRVGEVSESSFELLVRLEYPAALVGRTQLQGIPYGELESDPAHKRRSLIAAARLGLSQPEPRPEADLRAALWAKLEAFEEWVLCPCETHAQSFEVAGQPKGASASLRRARTIARPLFGLLDPNKAKQFAAGRRRAALISPMVPVVFEVGAEDPEGGEESQLRPNLQPLCSYLSGGEGELVAALRADLAPWILGYGDPVLERVQARRTGA